MKEVKFVKQWRGHAAGAVVELTDGRAAELQALGYCNESAAPPEDKPAKPKAKPKKASKEPEETGQDE